MHIEKLSLIRDLMEQRGVDAYFIPSTDPHLGEHLSDHWCIIQWLTGFTGSSATVIITRDFAGLWTDSRYLIQAEKQLGSSGITLMKPGLSESTGYLSWLRKNPGKNSKIGFDGRIVSVTVFRKIKEYTEERSISFDTECDLITELWSDRPSVPGNSAFDYPLKYSGRGRDQKLKEVREEMIKYSVEYHLLTSPDDIMWLLNIRGKDLKYSPLLMSFAIVGQEQLLLFAEEEKIPYKIAEEFDKNGIVILPYEEAAGMLSTLMTGAGILIDPSVTSVTLNSSIEGRMSIKEDISIPSRLKAVKSPAELSNLGNAMIRDGVALTRFFYMIEHNIDVIPMSELSLSHRLDQLRSEQEHFLGLSFATIVAYNQNAALPHYTATPDSDSVISPEGILLVDSGGQYLDGTTDITRTISLGNPTAGQKKDFTLVLRGMISLATSVFPSGTYGYQLDVLARQYLWENGLNYGHGTGHGVGYCLNVHEGPQRISPSAGSGTRILPGMLISDEPAVYREGEYGIRTENLLVCYEDEETEFGKFNRFSTVSLCYIDTSLVDVTLLGRKEIRWLNKYHQEVFGKIGPHLTPSEREWLSAKTAPLPL